MIKLPEKILKNGINLEYIGVSNIAFERKYIPDILKYLIENDIAILGGDVLDDKTWEYGYNYDNWYLDNNDSKSWINYVSNSIEKAKKYINSYPNENALFTLILSKK